MPDRHFGTAQIADACLALGVPLRVAPVGLAAVTPGALLSGAVQPIQHYGSVDIFFEAMLTNPTGRVLVVDNQNRHDESCIGDLTVLEARYHQCQGFVVWGCHRDTCQLIDIGLPVFSYGACPAGPQRLDMRPNDALQVAQFGPFHVTQDDWVVADSDGAVFFSTAQKEAVLTLAQAIDTREQAHAKQLAQGTSLCEQFEFERYLEKRQQAPAYTFREHLAMLNRSIEV